MQRICRAGRRHSYNGGRRRRHDSSRERVQGKGGRASGVKSWIGGLKDTVVTGAAVVMSLTAIVRGGHSGGAYPASAGAKARLRLSRWRSVSRLARVSNKLTSGETATGVSMEAFKTRGNVATDAKIEKLDGGPIGPTLTIRRELTRPRPERTLSRSTMPLRGVVLPINWGHS